MEKYDIGDVIWINYREIIVPYQIQEFSPNKKLARIMRVNPGDGLWVGEWIDLTNVTVLDIKKAK